MKTFSNLQEGTDIFKFSQKLLSRLEKTFEGNSKILTAIGETGLDYYEMYKENMEKEDIEILKEIQRNSFRKHCQLAKKYNLPLSIHARELIGKSDCVTDILQILAEEGKRVL